MALWFRISICTYLLHHHYYDEDYHYFYQITLILFLWRSRKLHIILGIKTIPCLFLDLYLLRTFQRYFEYRNRESELNKVTFTFIIFVYNYQKFQLNWLNWQTVSQVTHRHNLFRCLQTGQPSGGALHKLDFSAICSCATRPKLIWRLCNSADVFHRIFLIRLRI